MSKANQVFVLPPRRICFGVSTQGWQQSKSMADGPIEDNKDINFPAIHRFTFGPLKNPTSIRDIQAAEKTLKVPYIYVNRLDRRL